MISPFNYSGGISTNLLASLLALRDSVRKLTSARVFVFFCSSINLSSIGLLSDTNLLDFSAILAGRKLLLVLERFEIKLQKARVN